MSKTENTFKTAETPDPRPAKTLYATMEETIFPACMLEQDYVRLGILYYVCLRRCANWFYYSPYDVAKWTGLNFQAVQKKMREMEREGLFTPIPPEQYTSRLRKDTKYYYLNEGEFNRRYISEDACIAVRARCDAKLRDDKRKCNNRKSATPTENGTTSDQKSVVPLADDPQIRNLRPSDQKSVVPPLQTDQQSVVPSDQKSVVPQISNLTKNEDSKKEELILERKIQTKETEHASGSVLSVCKFPKPEENTSSTTSSLESSTSSSQPSSPSGSSTDSASAASSSSSSEPSSSGSSLTLPKSIPSPPVTYPLAKEVNSLGVNKHDFLAVHTLLYHAQGGIVESFDRGLYLKYPGLKALMAQYLAAYRHRRLTDPNCPTYSDELQREPFMMKPDHQPEAQPVKPEQDKKATNQPLPPANVTMEQVREMLKSRKTKPSA